MKPMLLPVLAVLLAAAACSSDKSPLHLTGVTEVAGRQGVATDGTCYYVSGSTALYKYSLDGELLLANEQPFAAMTGDVNHIGDIDVHDGEIYAGCEYFMDGLRCRDPGIPALDSLEPGFRPGGVLRSGRGRRPGPCLDGGLGPRGIPLLL